MSPTAGEDYVGISKNLDFTPGVTMQTIHITILDDLGQPVLEGSEKFELVLRMPMNGILGEPSKATVFINDSMSDCKCSPSTRDERGSYSMSWRVCHECAHDCLVCLEKACAIMLSQCSLYIYLRKY